MSIKVQIYQLIGLSKLQYINFVDKQFNSWCESLSYDYYIPMRVLQKNVSLYNWYLKQWESRIAKPFLIENKGLIADGLKDTKIYESLLIDFIADPKSRMGTIYPLPIINTIKDKHYKTIFKND